jgi:DNA polymerase elongation subunit (family B)
MKVNSTFKRLYLDIETSPNIGFFWQAGYKLNIPHDNIIQERAIICVCYKWAHEKEVHSLEWKKGNDKQLLIQLVKIMNEADEIVGQNSDNFDMKWLRTRCLFHKIPMQPEYNQVDTYKLAKKYFRFNSNKLDYMSSFLGHGNKMSTGYSLWKDIVLDNSAKAMALMVKYCKRDILLTEKVHQNMIPFVKHKTHVAVLNGFTKLDCPECSSTHTQSRGYWITAAGTKKNKCQCQDCGKWYSVAQTTFVKEMYNRFRKDKV